MRSFAFASLVVIAAIAGACSAVDDFRKFSFTDGGVDTDMGGPLPGFGQACTDACDPGPGATLGRPLTCFRMIGSRTAPGGMCTRTCTPGSIIACSDFGPGVADCVTVEGIALCLPHCGSINGKNCRTNWECCANHNAVTDSGNCAPSTTDLCH